MFIVKYFDIGVDSTEFQSILIVGKSAVGAHGILSPPTLRLDGSASSLAGLHTTTI